MARKGPCSNPACTDRDNSSGQWAYVPEHEAMATELYMHLATFVVHGYIIPGGRVHQGGVGP